MKVYISQRIPECAEEVLSEAGFEILKADSNESLSRNDMALLAARNIVEVLNNRKAITPVSSS
jgi:hypothetical protein